MNPSRYQRTMRTIRDFQLTDNPKKDLEMILQIAKDCLDPPNLIDNDQRFQRLLNFCEDKNWKCLSDSMEFAQSNIEFQCDKGHKFKSSYAKLIHNHGDCPDCLFLRKKSVVIDRILEYCENNGGELLRDEYVSAEKGNCYIRCKEGHEWAEPWISLKRRKTFCPFCKTN